LKALASVGKIVVTDRERKFVVSRKRLTSCDILKCCYGVKSIRHGAIRVVRKWYTTSYSQSIVGVQTAFKIIPYREFSHGRWKLETQFVSCFAIVPIEQRYMKGTNPCPEISQS